LAHLQVEKKGTENLLAFLHPSPKIDNEENLLFGV
jgi:hypothetical protein